MKRRPPGPGERVRDAELPSRVLRAFEARARERGLRAVVMAELARDLGVSTRTLYRAFPTKAALVHAVLEGWARDVEAAQPERGVRTPDPVARVHAAAVAWLEGSGRFSQAFWAELARDFPRSHTLYARTLRDVLARAREGLEDQLRPGLSTELAFAVLVAAIARAVAPDVCQRANATRSDAARVAIEIWARGALRPRLRIV